MMIVLLLKSLKILQAMINSPNALEQNKAFTKHIAEAVIQAREDKLQQEASIPRK